MERNSSKYTLVGQYGVAGVVLCITFATLVPIDLSIARFLGNNAPYVVASLFAAGLFSVSLRNSTLMKTCFLSTAIMAIVLRSSVVSVSPNVERYIEPLRTDISVAHVSTGNFSSVSPYGLEEIVEEKATDLICVQQLTPDWCEYLSGRLADEFPYHYTYEDIGLQGIGLYARRPLGYVDTVHLGGVVNIEACVSGVASTPEVHLLGVQTLPPINSFAYHQLRHQLEAVADHLQRVQSPVIVLGDFNSVPWSDELQDFQYESELSDSRRSIQSTFVKGAPQLFEVPVEHIFYSDRLRCLNYETMRSIDGYLGNRATFQDKSILTPLASL